MVTFDVTGRITIVGKDRDTIDGSGQTWSLLLGLFDRPGPIISDGSGRVSFNGPGRVF